MDEDEEVVIGYNGFENRGVVGTPLAEVFSIIIKMDDTKECQIYGTITVTDSNGSLFIYNKKREDPETTYHNGNLGIITQDHAISGNNQFTVQFNLMDKNNGDDVLINNSFIWDKGLCEDIEGKHGSTKATMYYIVYEVAIEANIWVHYESESALDCESASSDILHAHGRVIARYKKRGDWPNRKIQKDYNEFVMFESKSFELKHNDILQVSRSVVVLPVFHSLSILVDLKQCGSKEQLWNGEAEFFSENLVMNSPCVKMECQLGHLGVYAAGFCHLGSLECVNQWKAGMREWGSMP